MGIQSSQAMVEDALREVQTLEPQQAIALWQQPQVLFVDIRETAELAREGLIPGALHAPRGVLEFWVDPASDWHRPELAVPGQSLLLYCAIGWRSALAAQVLQRMGVPRVSHLGGGFSAWRAAGGAVERLADKP